MGIISTIVDLSKREYPSRARIVLITLGAPFFIVLIPLLLIWSASDPLSAILHPRHTTSGLIIAIAGLYIACWAVWTLFSRGRGTPIPIMSTQQLARSGPYLLCRNPMALGTIMYYLGISICLFDATPLLITAGFALLLLSYINLTEEKEVCLRFGDEYEVYKKSTPFIIPRWRELVKLFHFEGIPWPGSVVYNALSGTDIFRRHYQLVAQDIARYGTAHRILDIGTGPGRLLIALRQTFPDAALVGVDISPAMVAEARRNMNACGKRYCIEVKVADANALPFADATFDRVVSTAAFHHWKDPIRALSEAHRVLKIDGYALIYDLVRNMPKEVCRDVRARFGSFRLTLMWLHSFEEPFLNAEEMEALGRQTDFTVEETRFTGALCCLVLKKTALNENA
jgi:ubiquinone/menaquinone biosynthesis C-methylase UbiE/protein-S-isoprenylcysteine O-methyltransferase Ste14